MGVMLEQKRLRRTGVRNLARAALLFSGMLAVLGSCIWVVGGATALLVTSAMMAVGLIVAPALTPATVMRLNRGVPIPSYRLPEITTDLSAIARHAGLRAIPMLYWLPDRNINAVAVGSPGCSAIGLSDGAFRALSLRELRAVLAHEVAHIAAGDTRMLRLTGLIAQLTRWTAFFGLLIALFMTVLLDALEAPVWAVILLGGASPLVGLMELAFWRNREFAADLGAVATTGDPLGLVLALERIERMERSGVPWLVGRAGPMLTPVLLRTHPPTRERVTRLLEHVRLTPVTSQGSDHLEVLNNLIPVAWGPK